MMKYFIGTIAALILFGVQQLHAQQKPASKDADPRVIVVFNEGFFDKEKIMISAEDIRGKDSVYFNEPLKRPHGINEINEYIIPFPSDLSRRVRIVLPKRKQTIEYLFYLRKDIIILLDSFSGLKVVSTIADHPVILD